MIPPIDRGAPALDPAGTTQQPPELFRSSSGNIEFTLRNPWGHNDLHEAPANSTSPLITIKAEMTSASLAQFSIGPSPADTGVG
jgi:hypothetical protein